MKALIDINAFVKALVLNGYVGCTDCALRYILDDALSTQGAEKVARCLKKLKLGDYNSCESHVHIPWRKK